MKRSWLLAGLLILGATVSPVTASPWADQMDAMETAAARRDVRTAVQSGAHAIRDAENIGPDSAQLALTLNEVARVHAELGLPENAVKLLTRLQRLLEKHVGPKHPSVDAVLGSLTAMHRKMAGAAWKANDVAKAEVHLGDALATMRRRHGDAHPAVAELLRELSLTAEKSGHLDTAAERLAESVAVLRRAGDSAALILALEDFGDLQSVRGHAAEAEALLKESLQLTSRLLGRDHAKFARLLEHLAVILDATGQPARARRAYERALDRWTAKLGETHPLVIARRTQLSKTLPLPPR